MKNPLLLMTIAMFLMTSCIHRNNLRLKFENIDSNDIEVYLSAGGPFLSTEIATCIYKNGTINAIPNEYGENDWLIIYKNEKICMFRHFKTNRNDKHLYFFTLYSDSSNIYCDVYIRGMNEVKKNIQLIDIPQDMQFNKPSSYRELELLFFTKVRDSATIVRK